jgi:hypothetical protein
MEKTLNPVRLEMMKPKSRIILKMNLDKEPEHVVIAVSRTKKDTRKTRGG